MKDTKQLNVEIPEDIIFDIDNEHKITGKSKKRIVEDRLRMKQILGRL